MHLELWFLSKREGTIVGGGEGAIIRGGGSNVTEGGGGTMIGGALSQQESAVLL